MSFVSFIWNQVKIKALFAYIFFFFNKKKRLVLLSFNNKNLFLAVKVYILLSMGSQIVLNVFVPISNWFDMEGFNIEEHLLYDS